MFDDTTGRFHDAVFDALYSRSLVYNACWEDPAVDRAALAFTPDDTVMVITSAGCNALDYALAGAGRIHAVDANPRQTALLELKLAGIAMLEFEDFFEIFGNGAHSEFDTLYSHRLRPRLSDAAQAFWDKRTHWFDARRNAGFYYRGLAGTVARAFRLYFRWRPQLRNAVEALLHSPDLTAQRTIYDTCIQPLLWNKGVDRALSSAVTLSLLGVPREQHAEVRRQHPGGVPGFVRDAVRYIACELPIADNYFWQLYLRGHYTRACCPEYLKAENFERLKQGVAARIVPHTSTVTHFLCSNREPISKFVLLDHMDWLGARDSRALADEWAAILARAAPGARIIFRSAHARPWFIEQLSVSMYGRLRPLYELLRFDNALARRLQVHDRVHTYAGFHIAEAAA